MLETGSNYDKKYLTKNFFISTFFFRFTVYQTTKTIKVMASIKLSRGSKVTVTGPVFSGGHIPYGSTMYAIRYSPSSETWQVSRSKGGPIVASVRRKHLKPVTESETGFKKGDRVQVKSGTVVSSALYGKYGTIQKNDGSSTPFYVKLEDASINGAWFKENEITKVAAKPEAPKKTDELTVDADFLKAAHAAACSEWKKKLEKKYPSVFKKPKTWKPMPLGSKITLSGDGSKDIFIGMGLAPDGLTGRCLMMRKDKVVPEITSEGQYFVVTFKTLQD